MSLASLFSPPSPCLCLSSLSRSHTPNTHNKNTTNLLISTRLVMSCLARGMRRSPQECSPARHIHTNIQREEPAVTKQHAPNIHENRERATKQICVVTLNVGSGVRKVSLLLSSDFDYFFCVSAFNSRLLLKPTECTQSVPTERRPHRGPETIECQCGFVDTNPCSDSLELPTKPFLCETPASVYFHLQG